MNKPLKNLQDEAAKIRLSPQEKAYMRAQLLEVMRRSSVSIEPRPATRSPYFFFAPQFAMPFVVLMILVLGGTTTYAAQGSLPGGVLYPVKIYVNEQVQAALAVSDEAKVSYHTAVAQERLKEAEVLASQGKLDGQTASELEANFNDHVAKADTLAADLEKSDTATGVEAQIRLDSSLAAHGAILARIGDESSDEQTKENSNSIAQHVRSRSVSGVVAMALQAATTIAPTVNTMAFAQENSDASGTPTEDTPNSQTRFAAKTKVATTANVVVASATTTAQKKVALQLQKKASSQLDDAHQTFDDTRQSLDASTTVRVKTQLALLDAQLTAGSQQLAVANYTLARTTFSDILRGSIELSAFIEASKMYKHDFVHEDQDSHLDNEDNSSDSSSDEKGSGIQIKLNL